MTFCKNIKKVIEFVWILAFTLIACDNNNPEPPDFDITRIEGNYNVALVVHYSDSLLEFYDGTSSVSLLTDENFQIELDFNDSINFPVINGVVKDEFRFGLNQLGGVYFDIEELDTISGNGQFSDTGALQDGDIEIGLELQNKIDIFPFYLLNGTK